MCVTLPNLIVRGSDKRGSIIKMRADPIVGNPIGLKMLLLTSAFNVDCDFLVSRRLAGKRPKKSPSSVTQFLENRSLLFSETLQLSRTWIADKNVPSGFLKKILNLF